MKKLLFTLVLAVVSVYAMAQESAAAPVAADADTMFQKVTRVGNTYSVGNNAMNSKAFMGYLQSRDAVSYQTFRSARNLANAGWGLLAVGLACEIASVPMLIYGTMNTAKSVTSETTGDEAAKKADQIANIAVASEMMLIGGGLVSTAGVVCISLGYVRMHETAEIYNGTMSYRRKQAGMNVALQSSRDGIGIALQF